MMGFHTKAASRAALLGGGLTAALLWAACAPSAFAADEPAAQAAVSGAVAGAAASTAAAMTAAPAAPPTGKTVHVDPATGATADQAQAAHRRRALRHAAMAHAHAAMAYAHAAAMSPPMPPPMAPRSYDLVVGNGKSQVLQLPGPYSDLMIADPKIADVIPLTATSIYVVGKGVGSTSLTVYGGQRRLMAAVNVDVSADFEGLKERLHELLPGERDITIRPANDSVVLSGTVSSPAALGQIVTLTKAYAGDKVVNMLTVEGSQQVMLSVRFVEMERTAEKDFNFSLMTSGGNNSFQIATGQPLQTVSGSPTFGSLGATAKFGNTTLSVTLDALENKGLIKTLAEPNLTTMSGETASFLAGGEFPIPIASSIGGVGIAPTVTVEFKQFGIGLAFTPTILEDGLINLIVNPEVSQIDPTISINTGLVNIPGLKVRRAHATVELRDGESFAIAGLLSDNYQANINQFPFLGDVPVLGALFRSNGFKKDQTELVVVVTPHLVTPRKDYVAVPTDHFVPPSDLELFMLGQQQGEMSNVRPEDRVLMTTDPTTGGLDGPHGHVLY